MDLEDEVRELRSLVQQLREENGRLTRLLRLAPQETAAAGPCRLGTPTVVPGWHDHGDDRVIVGELDDDEQVELIEPVSNVRRINSRPKSTTTQMTEAHLRRMAHRNSLGGPRVGV